MALRAVLAWLTGGSEKGLFPYLGKRVEQKEQTERAKIEQNAQTERAKSWQDHTTDLQGHLRDGTFYREITPDGSVEIWTPSASHIAMTVECREAELNSREPPEIQTKQPRALGQEGLPIEHDPFADSAD